MTTFADLIKKKSTATEEAKENWSLDDTTDQTFADESTEQTTPTNPMDVLRQTLAGVKKAQTVNPRPDAMIIDDPMPVVTADEIESAVENAMTPIAADPNAQFQNPTMTDVSNYVFEEQPDESTQEITNKFDILLSDLSAATGNDIPDLLAKNLLFIKEHPFLAEILKPDSIGHLCNAMRKSYGHVVQAKTERSAKTKARSVKETAVLDSLAGLSF